VNANLDEAEAAKAVSVREMLERHRANPTCASCHARMDPLGFSLENFDALGQWRANDGDSPINATGVLLDGTKVDGPAALRRALVAQKELFVRTVTAKLLTYAVGREMEYFDAPAIRGIVRAAAADDYRWSSTVLALVRSAPFQMRRSLSVAGTPSVFQGGRRSASIGVPTRDPGCCWNTFGVPGGRRSALVRVPTRAPGNPAPREAS
jgi:hypothetical protein